MSYAFMNNGDVFAIGYEGQTYIGRIDSEGDWRPDSDEHADLEEYLLYAIRRELICWANGDNQDWTPDSAQLRFAGFEPTVNDWDSEKREWRPIVAARILENATAEEKHDAGLLER